MKRKRLVSDSNDDEIDIDSFFHEIITKKNYNHINVLFNTIESDSSIIYSSCVDIFSYFFNNLIISFNSTQEISQWVFTQYVRFMEIICKKIVSGKEYKLIKVFMKFCKMEYYYHAEECFRGKNNELEKFVMFMDKYSYGGFVRKIVEGNDAKLIEYFREFSKKYADLCVLNLYSLNKCVNEKNLVKLIAFTDKMSFVGIQNHSYFKSIDFWKGRGETQKKRVKRVYKIPKLLFNEVEQKKVYESFWVKLLLIKNIPMNIYRIILLRLENSIILNFNNPLLLAGFVKSSFDKGGLISLLSLKAIFLLMTKCNLIYPQYYERLYSLINKDVLSSNVNEKRVFLDLVYASLLKSSKVPEIIIASFIKKFSRMALVSSPETIAFIITLVYNLLRKYKGLIQMINRSNEKKKDHSLSFDKDGLLLLDNKKEGKSVKEDVIMTNIGNDPFDVNENDLFKTNAINSCLWEFETLANHYSSEIAKRIIKFQYLVKNGLKKKMGFDKNDYSFFHYKFDKNQVIPNYSIKKNLFSF